MSIAEQILAEAARLPEGWPVQAKTLLHLGGRPAIDQALSRLHQTGDLLRLSRGSYVRMVDGRFGLRPPALARVVRGWATATSEIITADGAKAANALGLSTQVPVRPVYLTSGRTRTLTVGKQKIALRHAPDWQLLLPGRLAGDAVRALSWLGPRVSARAIAQLRQKLPQTEQDALEAIRPQLPRWLAGSLARWLAIELGHLARAQA